MNSPLKKILNELRKRNIKVAYYTVSTDYETGEHTIIIRTPSIVSIRKSSILEDELQNTILKNYKNWYLIIIPIGKNRRKASLPKKTLPPKAIATTEPFKTSDEIKEKLITEKTI